MNPFSHKKILVTGGSGHFGSAIVHYLVNKVNVPPQSIRIFYLKDSPTDSLKDISGLDFFAGNVLNADEVNRAFENVQLVFHTVGSTTFDPRQKKIQWLVNVEGTRNVLEACLHSATFEKLCYTSTVNALGVPNPVGSIGDFETSNPYTNVPRQHSFASQKDTLNFIEQARANKSDWVKQIGVGYYDSKLAAQELVNEYYEKHRLNVVSLMPGTMFGPHDFLIGTGLYLLSVYKNKMPFVLRGSGMPLAHVMDVARGQVLAMEKAKAGTQYILSGKEEDNRRLLDMVSTIAEVLKEKFPDKEFRKPFLEIPYSLALIAAFFSERLSIMLNKPMLLSRDAVRAGANLLFYTSQKAKHDLRYEPQFTFRQAVSDMADYYNANGLMESEGRWIDRR
jgi:dihydroflavonol-4-reductase